MIPDNGAMIHHFLLPVCPALKDLKQAYEMECFVLSVSAVNQSLPVFFGEV